MTLFLHIGHFKTATTSLQTWCYEHQDALLETSIAYPKGGELLPCQHGEAFLAAARHQDWTRLEKLILDHAQYDKILLSAETLSNLPAGAVGELCARLQRWRPLHILYVVRNWLEYLPSRYRQNIRRGDGWRFDQFLAESARVHHYNADHDFAINARHYAQSGAQVSVFEYDSDVIERLLQTIGVNPALRARTMPRRNESDSFVGSETRRLINVVANQLLDQPQNRMFQALLKQKLLPKVAGLDETRRRLAQRINPLEARELCNSTSREWVPEEPFCDYTWHQCLERIGASPNTVVCHSPGPRQLKPFMWSEASSMSIDATTLFSGDGKQ